MTGFAPASLPLIEATVHSVLYGVWRAWQLTRYLAKALSRCVCCVPPHKFKQLLQQFRYNQDLYCLHRLATEFLLVY